MSPVGTEPAAATRGSPAASSGAEPRDDRIAALDGVRASAAVAVVVAQVAAATRLAGDGDGAGRVLHHLGITGIAVFMVLSGYLLYRPFAVAALRDDATPEPARLLVRRLVRIWPPYAVAAGVALVVGPVLADALAPDELVGWFTLTQPYRRDDGPAGLSVTWAVASHLAFAVLLPFAAAGIRALGARTTSRRARLEAQIAGLATLVGMAAIYRWLVAVPALADPERHPLAPFHLWLPNHLDWFAAGMGIAVAAAWHDDGRALPGWLSSLAARPVPAQVVAAALVGSAILIPVAGTDDLGRSLGSSPAYVFARVALAGAAAVALVAPLVLGPRGPAPVRSAGRRGLRLAGGLAYGLVLWHAVWLPWFAAGREAGPGRPGFWTMLGVVGGASLLSAGVSWFLLERPIGAILARRPVHRGRDARPGGAGVR